MDILIKSFNRAYYLDRCLHSIFTHLKNFTGSISILDDGTPSVYLEKIQLKYPSVIVLKSNNYKIKSKLIETKNYNLPNKIPSKLWYASALEISDYFILLEDDMWFAKSIDVASLYTNCKKENVALLKLFWLGNSKLISDISIKSFDNMVIYKPNLQFNNPTIFKYIYTKHNVLWRKLMIVFGLRCKEKELHYYSIYSVAGAVFKKDYYLSIWKNASTFVNEKQQLVNAVTYKKNNKVFFSRTKDEVLKTSFLSSAFPKNKYPEFSIHDFNFTLNEFWLENDHLFCTNLEFDLDENKIKNILKLRKKSTSYINEWQDWVSNFKKQYQKIGCNI